jgi:hypothetical protein
MKELLDKLKSLDPTTYKRAFCWFDNVLGEIISDNPEGYFLEDGPYLLRDALLQSVLQEAISSKGWYWGFAVGTSAAIVSKDMENFVRRLEDFPVKSLLAAYIAACEAKT